LSGIEHAIVFLVSMIVVAAVEGQKWVRRRRGNTA
jgi:hypothetical protein